MMMKRQRDAEAELNLPPGFRFHPTDEELVVHYLCRRISHQSLPVPIIAEVDLYKYDPWTLPEKAMFGAKEWYFFTPRDRKYPNGSRPNRAAGSGYWKATGADKPIKPPGHSTNVGIKKALVFYSGKAPKGIKTDWIMHEYRLADTNRSSKKNGSLRLDNWVLCRLYNKKNNWKITTEKEPKLRVIQENAESLQTGSDSLMSPESDVENDFHTDEVFGKSHSTTTTNVNHLQQGNAFEAAYYQQGTNSDHSTNYSDNGFKMEMKEEEENDWFMGLNLDDLQTSLSGFGSILPSSSPPMLPTQNQNLNYTNNQQDYAYPSTGLYSPHLKQPYQTNLLPNWSN